MSKDPSWSILGRSPEQQAAAVAFGRKADERRQWRDVLDHSDMMQRARKANTPAPSDEERAAVYAYEKDFRERKAKQGEAPRPDGSLLKSLDILKHAFMNDDEAKTMAKVALGGAGVLSGMAAPLLVPAAPVASAAAINALTGLPLSMALDMPEGVPQDAVAGAMMGHAASRLHPLAALPAALASYAATNINDAEAGSPLNVVRRFFSSKTGVPQRPFSLYGRPEAAEIMAAPQVTTKLRHNQPFTEQELERYSGLATYPVSTRPEQEQSVFNGDLESIFGGQKFAGGGLVKGLKMLFPNLAEPMHVVKPKGGNWLSGSVEDALKGLKTPLDIQGLEEIRNMDDVARQEALVSYPGFKERLDRFNTADSVNNWIEGPLTKYVKTRMASPDDEVRKLAEQGVLHISPDNLRDSARFRSAVEEARRKAGFPEMFSTLQEGRPTHAYDWENASDSFIAPQSAGSLANTVTVGGKNPGPTYLQNDPWLSKIDPDTPVYTFATRSTVVPQLAPSLGFDHLIDELSNALNPNSGLPRHLQLTPEAMKNLSMEKAVRRVAEINEWRAAQKVEANRQLAEQAAIVREYADNNPKGLRWVELKAPAVTGKKVKLEKQYEDVVFDLPDDVQNEIADQSYKEVSKRLGKEFGDETDKFRELFHEIQLQKSKEWAKKNPQVESVDESKAFLRDALKYEGDTMGHCVGGYCDDVFEGRARIFSLRDAKGEPHVTVEVEPAQFDTRTWTKMSPEQRARVLEVAGEEAGNTRLGEVTKQLFPEVEWFPSRIIQIKGKGNKKPNDEYLPFVQDFVRNNPLGGQWADVEDLQNTGLMRREDILAGRLSPEFAGRPITIDQYKEALKKFQMNLPEDAPTMATPDEWLKFLGFAQGGHVTNNLPSDTVSRNNSGGWNILHEAIA